MDQKLSVGDIVTRSGDDRHIVMEIGDYNNIVVRCIEAPKAGWCKVGETIDNLAGRFQIVQKRSASVIEPCPLCEAPAMLQNWEYRGAHASGMETPHPFVECSACGLKSRPIACDDSPSGRKNGAKTYVQARAEAEVHWNTRPMTVKSAAHTS